MDHIKNLVQAARDLAEMDSQTLAETITRLDRDRLTLDSETADALIWLEAEREDRADRADLAATWQR